MMDDMNAFERQIASVVQQTTRWPRPVDVASIVRDVPSRSLKWRFESIFSATKFVVAGVIVALFGGFLLAGLLTQPSDQPLAPAAASASSSPEADTSEQSVRSDLLPGVDLISEEVAPGVYRVLGDGVRDITDRVGQVTINPEGDVWVELSTGKKNTRNLVRLGEPGVSLKVTRGVGATLGMTAGGAPVVVRPDVVWRFDGEAWRKTELSEYDACWAAPLDGGWLPAVAADGACYTRSFSEDEALVRIDADGTRTALTRDELGLGPEQNGVLQPEVGPDGSIWAPVFETDFSTGIFRGLVRYDGSVWSFIPYEGDDAELCGSCFGGFAVGRDGVVWFPRRGRGLGDAATVLSWDGESWGSYPQAEGFDLDPDPSRVWMAQAWPNGDVWFGSEAHWDGTTFSLAEPPIPWGEVWSRATAPDGSAWAAIDRQLYIVTPEAVMVTE